VKAAAAWDNAGDVNILVAEDDRDIADLIAHYFSRAGWRAHITETGDEALASVRRNPADVCSR